MKIKSLLLLVLCYISFTSTAFATNKILVVVTGASELSLKGGEVYKTGYWLEEFSVPYQVFIKNGFEVTIATPKGDRPTADHGSISVGKDGKPLYWNTIEELDEALAVKKQVLDEGKIISLKKLSNEDLKGFDAVFFPGGHGPMTDMLNNSDVARVLKHFHTNKKVTALVCHAPAVLVSTANKKFLYAGYKVTAFTDAEEAQTPVGPKMKTTPQRELEKAGASFIVGPAWQANVIEDRELITGQNPASSRPLAEAVVRRFTKE